MSMGVEQAGKQATGGHADPGSGPGVKPWLVYVLLIVAVPLGLTLFIATGAGDAVIWWSTLIWMVTFYAYVIRVRVRRTFTGLRQLINLSSSDALSLIVASITFTISAGYLMDSSVFFWPDARLGFAMHVLFGVLLLANQEDLRDAIVFTEKDRKSRFIPLIDAVAAIIRVPAQSRPSLLAVYIALMAILIVPGSDEWSWYVPMSILLAMVFFMRIWTRLQTRLGVQRLDPDTSGGGTQTPSDTANGDELCNSTKTIEKHGAPIHQLAPTAPRDTPSPSTSVNPAPPSTSVNPASPSTSVNPAPPSTNTRIAHYGAVAVGGVALGWLIASRHRH